MHIVGCRRAGEAAHGRGSPGGQLKQSPALPGFAVGANVTSTEAVVDLDGGRATDRALAAPVIEVRPGSVGCVLDVGVVQDVVDQQGDLEVIGDLLADVEVVGNVRLQAAGFGPVGDRAVPTAEPRCGQGVVLPCAYERKS